MRSRTWMGLARRVDASLVRLETRSAASSTDWRRAALARNERSMTTAARIVQRFGPLLESFREALEFRLDRAKRRVVAPSLALFDDYPHHRGVAPPALLCVVTRPRASSPESGSTRHRTASSTDREWTKLEQRLAPKRLQCRAPGRRQCHESDLRARSAQSSRRVGGRRAHLPPQAWRPARMPAPAGRSVISPPQ